MSTSSLPDELPPFKETREQVTYCGVDPTILPFGYDSQGTRQSCLRKGVGIGIMMSGQERTDAQMRLKNKPHDPTEPKIYCGGGISNDPNLLPEGYARFGTRPECLRKGVGVGLMLSDEEQELAMGRMRGGNATRQLNIHELRNLAIRLDVPYEYYDANRNTILPKSRLQLIMDLILRFRELLGVVANAPN